MSADYGDLSTTEPSNELVALANRINAEHAEVIKHVQQGADHAIRAGRFLLDARIEVPSGHFEEWVGANCRFSVRSAQLATRPGISARPCAWDLANLGDQNAGADEVTAGANGEDHVVRVWETW